MDKKKVEELIEQIQKYCDQAYSPNWQPKSFEEFVKLGNICREAIKELSKSDWVSVEDELPPYNENVEVCSKVKPTEVWIDSRDKYIDVGNSFRYNKLYGNIITHWKPIDKLEE